MIPFNTEEAMKSGTYISGTTGTGKSDIAMYQAEQLMKEGIIVIVFDPSQDWPRRSFLEHYWKITSQLAEMYEWIPDHSSIFDISELSVKQAQRFVEGFCNAIMTQQAKPKCMFNVDQLEACENDVCQKCEFRKADNKDIYCNWKPKRYFLIFEEAHMYFPQGCMTAIAMQNTVRMMTQGRNFGVRFCCITQFASMIDKKAMRYMRQRYFGYTDEPNDTEYILRMFPKEFKEHGTRYLMGLKAGQFIYKCGNEVDQFEITPFTSETKPQLAEVSQRRSPTITPQQYQNTGGGAAAILRLTFLTIFATIFLWIIANAKR
jgi:hypothetical protein